METFETLHFEPKTVPLTSLATNSVTHRVMDLYGMYPNTIFWNVTEGGLTTEAASATLGIVGSIIFTMIFVLLWIPAYGFFCVDSSSVVTGDRYERIRNVRRSSGHPSAMSNIRRNAVTTAV